MKLLLIAMVVCFFSFNIHAWTLEPSAAMTAANTYKLANIDAEYDLSGALFRIDGLFDFGEPLILDTHRYYWGFSLAYGSLEGDLKDPSMASASLASTANFQLYIPYFILGMTLSDVSVKLLLTPHIHIRETEGVTQGDEKYGYGGGLEIGYKAFENLSLNIGYHYYMCDRGKNSSTGQSGTLTNDVTLSFITAGLSFPLSFNSMGGATDSPYRRRRSGVR